MKKKLSNTGLHDLLLRLWSYTSPRRQAQCVLLLALMLVNMVAQVVSLGAVVPFLGVLVNPEAIFNYSIIADLGLILGISSANQLLLPLTIVFVVSAFLAGLIQILLLWVSMRLVVALGSEVSLQIYRRTLYQPYEVHAGRNSSEVISGIATKVNGVIFGIWMPLFTLISSSILLIAITLTLIAIDPLVASVGAVSFGASYGLISWLSRRRLVRNSERIANEQTQVVKALQEGLGGIRDVLLDGTQLIYCDIYRQADTPLRKAQGNNLFIAGCPRPAMEALGIVMIAILAYSLNQSDGGITKAIPVLGAIALGAQRLLPTLQQIYASWTNITGNRASLVDIIGLLEQAQSIEQMEHPTESLILHHSISFDKVRFRYSRKSPWVLDGLNLTIPSGARVGIVGPTGSGKSTMLDLLMGLLKATEGELLVDGIPLSGSRVRAWQQTIAHVPQNIFLADNTLAANIAFGVPVKDIDYDRVRQAARGAQIADFIECQPEGYNAFAGEQGIRLSGGQRQRIGIARALYKQASVLVFDEATSALDNATEQLVMNTIDGLGLDLTVLIIAHRLTTVQRCDIIVELQHGRVMAQGSYEELLERSPSFYQMANIK